jgi:DNA-binding NarL/FixJ family response regulator
MTPSREQGNGVVLIRRDDPGGLTVVVADDHPVVRGGLRAVLAGSGEITVVGEAATGRDAVHEALRHRPDVLVTDLPSGDPGVVREVARSAPGVGVLVFTLLEDDDSVLAAIRAGARGYLHKCARHEDIVRAVHGVAAGEAVFGARIAVRLAGLLSTRTDSAPFPDLTTRERQVLDLLAAGVPNPAIARRLQLAPKTVANHISAIFAKLGVTGRPEAIVRARDAGLGRGSE